MFRRDNKGENFERQMGALRQQLGDSGMEDDEDLLDEAPQATAVYGEPERSYGYTPQGSVDGGEPVAPEAPAIPEVDASTTVIARDTTWKGDMTSDGSVHIHGRFDGAVKAENEIFVAEGAEVDATLTAQTIVVAGTSRGTVRSRGKFEVLPSGKVAGDIFAPTLVVHEGATMSGQLRMTNTEEPKETKPTPVIQRRANRGA
ncbi:MAG: polymer-forming cytoskeletal protein [Chloroflexota bacterium]|nr:polymer-forming cytoskeletal protein [Chloroflexota bacterium]